LATSPLPLALAATIFSYKSPGRRMILKIDGRVSMLAEVAATPADTAKGLSGRTSVPDGEGMLFVMRAPTQLSFWMRGTSVPLSIAFLADDGTILETHDMQPFSEQSTRSSVPARLALEVPQGWFGRRGIGVGSVVTVVT